MWSKVTVVAAYQNGIFISVTFSRNLASSVRISNRKNCIYAKHTHLKGNPKQKSIMGPINSNRMKIQQLFSVDFRSVLLNSTPGSRENAAWAVPFCVWQSVSLWHEQSWQELWRHESTLFCSSLVKSEAAWLRPGELTLEGDKYFCCVLKGQAYQACNGEYVAFFDVFGTACVFAWGSL